jgi:predicted transcriptional regulator
MVSKKELAEIMGAARQSLFRTLSELQEQGVVSIDGRAVKILSPDELSHMAEESE